MPKAAAIHYLNVCHSGNSRSKSANKQRRQRLSHVCHSAKYERSSSSHVLEPENHKAGLTVLVFLQCRTKGVLGVLQHPGPQFRGPAIGGYGQFYVLYRGPHLAQHPSPHNYADLLFAKVKVTYYVYPVFYFTCHHRQWLHVK